MSNLATVRAHLSQIRIAFLRYRSGWQYLWMRYVIAPKIRRYPHSLEKAETTSELSMHVLTGHRDVTILLWALASYYAVSATIGSLTVHDDGSLTTEDTGDILRLFPSVKIVTKDSLRSRASLFSNYPHLVSFFETPFWQARKLLDPYLTATRPFILLLDTDVLWFCDPTFIATAVKEQKEVAYMMQNNTPCPMPFLDGTQLDSQRSFLNSGIVFFHRDALKLPLLEEYLERTGVQKHHFLEQAGYAFALEQVQPLSTTDYTIKGTSEADAIARHYTGPSRGKFYIRGLPYVLTHSLSHVRH